MPKGLRNVTVPVVGRRARARRAVLVLATVLVTGLCGCRPVDHAVTRHIYRGMDRGDRSARMSISFRSVNGEPPLVVDERKLPFAGEVSAGHVSAKYQEGLADAAERLVLFTDAVLSETERELGLPMQARLGLVVLAVERHPSSLHAKLRSETVTYRQPVFLTPQEAAGDAPPETFLRELPTIVHELAEITLGQSRPRRTLQDFAWGPFRVVNYTRWFRDGYANYAGYVAMQAARRRLGNRWPAGMAETEDMHGRPFSSLKRVGRPLFRWHQFTTFRPSLLNWGRFSVVASEADNERYAAATGLFLLIERRFGRDAIRRITDEAAKLKYPDGDALVFTCNRALGTDVRRLHESLPWPDLGMRVHRMYVVDDGGSATAGGLIVESVRPGGSAERAGVEPDDVIVSVNGRPVRDEAEIELVLFDGLDRATAEVVVRRAPWNERPPVTLEVPLVPLRTAGARVGDGGSMRVFRRSKLRRLSGSALRGWSARRATPTDRARAGGRWDDLRVESTC